MGVKMHSDRARNNKTVDICMELFFHTIVTTSCWLYTCQTVKFGLRGE